MVSKMIRIFLFFVSNVRRKRKICQFDRFLASSYDLGYSFKK